MDRLEEWDKKWSKGTPRWHLDRVNYALFNHSSTFLPTPNRRVLVPLCGKSVDLKWLYDAGHTVIGVDGAEQPVLEFYTENKIPCDVEEFSGGKIYKSKDERLLVYCCDLFILDAATLGKFDAVWDRGSLVAIYEEDRDRYAKLIKSVLSPDFRYLLSVVQYKPTPEFSGPPRNVPNELVKQLFGDICQLKVLEAHTDVERDEDAFAEVILMLTSK